MKLRLGINKPFSEQRNNFGLFFIGVAMILLGLVITIYLININNSNLGYIVQGLMSCSGVFLMFYSMDIIGFDGKTDKELMMENHIDEPRN